MKVDLVDERACGPKHDTGIAKKDIGGDFQKDSFLNLNPD